MGSSLFIWLLLFSVTLITGHKWNTTCTTRTQRPAWNALTDEEKIAYVEAEKCLQAKPAQAGTEGAENRWDELHWSHISQTSYIHGVGGFLPWHRYFVRVHEYLLQSECGYEGGQPYWNETADASDLLSSVVLDPDSGFGGDGNCITDGPFVDVRLRLNANGATDPYCIYRSLSARDFSSAVQGNVDACMETTSYEDARNCFEGSPHSAGHGGVGGLMVNVALSPGDPIFFLHHAYIDKIWWEWQELDIEARLIDMSGTNQPRSGGSPGGPPGLKLRADTFDYGDPGNETTLSHILGMVNIVPDAIIAEVMDLRGDLICAEYLD
ncbi:hypothetical protein V2G26_000260 [Clonostachys chloroleuca]